MLWYDRVLCHHPYAVVCCTSSLVAACLVVSITLQQLPAFNDPSLGFEARGTSVSSRAAAWLALLEATRPSGPLTVNPAKKQEQDKWPPNQHTGHGPPGRHQRPLNGRGINVTSIRRFPHTHMVCVEAVGGDVSVQSNCSSEDLQRLHELHMHPSLSTPGDMLSSIVDLNENTSVANISDDEFGNRSRSVEGVLGISGDGEDKQRSAIEKLRVIGLEHDFRHSQDNKDYLTDHEALENYDYYDYEDYEHEIDYDEEHAHHNHNHLAPDGFFCNSLVPDYGHLVVSVNNNAANCPNPSSSSAEIFSPFNFASSAFSRSESEPSNMSAEASELTAYSLMSLDHLQSICELDRRIREAPSFEGICQRASPEECCPSWSIPNYVALLTNKTRCEGMTEADVTYVRQLLYACGRHFDQSLEGGCGSQCSRLPPACMKHDAVYTILHYLADVHFMMHEESGAPASAQDWSSLRTSALFLPVARSSATLPFYEELAAMSLAEGNVSVISMELGVKNALFDKLLLRDAVLVIVAGAAVLLLVLIYTSSFIMTVVTIATVASSLIIAYFFYTFVFRISFFPYMNVLSCIIAVALGADDTFVFCRVWRSVARDSGGGGHGRSCYKVPVKFVEEVMNHAASSVVVTSLTTAAAFLASTTSAITAIKCFSLFAGTVVMANLLLMLTWVPACLVISERWRCCWCCSLLPAARSTECLDTTAVTAHHHNPTFTKPQQPHLSSNLPHPILTCSASANPASLDTPHHQLHHPHRSPIASPPRSPNFQSSNASPRTPSYSHNSSSHSTSQSPPRSPHIIKVSAESEEVYKEKCSVVVFSRISSWMSGLSLAIFERFLPWIVIKPRALLVILLLGFAVYAGILVMYYPRLRLPDSADFQLFNRDHYFERYDLEHKYNFWFERNLRSDVVNRLPIRVVWGIKPVDNGDHLNPASESTLEFDPTFDMSAPASQNWLLQFCRDLRKQSFYMSTMGPLLPNCFIETFKSWMEERRCADISKNRYPCCEVMPFPYPRWVFDKCITDAVEVLYQTPHLYFVPGVAGPKFNKTSGKVAALVIEYDSNMVWSLSFDQMHQFFTRVEDWTSKQLQDAPPGLRGGWFTSYLEFYEVQRSLLEGTKLAVLVAVVVSLVVLLLTTLNVLVSLVAVISVASVMLVSLAALVILGWRLNVLESIVVTAAIGLAVDMTLHYAVAYTKAPPNKRKAAVVWALTRLGSPVLMTTLTTLVAAVAMLSATVLAYIHIATFLIIISLASYIYSTFFFLPLMSLVGPERHCGQIVSPSDCSQFCSCRDEQHDKNIYQQACVSESTLSTSSVCPSAPYSSAHTTHDFETPYISCQNNTHELEPLTSPTFSSPFSLSYVPETRGGNGCCNSSNSGGEKSVVVQDCPKHSPNCTQKQPGHQQHSRGLIVSLQQNRNSRQQQNGSCAQLVVRKESTESQVSGSGDVGCVCRSASVGSRPRRSAGTGRKPRNSLNNRSNNQSRSCLKKHAVAKQNSSPHITPANSVSTLVCSEPDPELEGFHVSEQTNATALSTDRSRDGGIHANGAADKKSAPSPSDRNYQQQLRHQQFIRQHQQQQLQFDNQFCSADAAGSCV
ncbi:Protein patched/dispatched [Trinorchestia longiramus]|nr:Protein patched/dispatched [Trinorchestia longiramus]